MTSGSDGHATLSDCAKGHVAMTPRKGAPAQHHVNLHHQSMIWQMLLASRVGQGHFNWRLKQVVFAEPDALIAKLSSCCFR
jgi:hypothetical protein